MPANLDFIQQLREKTCIGLLDAARAQRECLGHFDLAERWVMTKGLAVACKEGQHPHDLVKAEAQRRGPA